MDSQRISTWWIKMPDLYWPDPDNLDRIKRRAEGFAKANVSAAMIFGTHFRWDYIPYLPLLHDYLATVAEELHSYGIKLYDHHSVNLVHRYDTREELRRVMTHSGPHLPFSPCREAAASWTYKGMLLNNWRMKDVRTGEPLYLPHYTAEGFCHRNPEFIYAYKEYLKELIADTNIDGLSADDGMYYMQYNACGCDHCRAELRRRAGIDLPPVEDRSFWFNWDNPAWNHWVDLRFDATGEFYSSVAEVLPEGFMLTGCGTMSASHVAPGMGSDARQFLQGCNYVNMEMVGNPVPYKHDPVTRNYPPIMRVCNASHHQACAREKGTRAFNTGFAHTTIVADHAWAISKFLGADAWIGTLKPRLGLPESILETLPREEDIVGEAFTFEKNHPELFAGDTVSQLGVYFSYETRNHTMFGNLAKGYSADYIQTVTTLLRNGLCPHTVFNFPEKPDKYPVILLPSAAKMTETEIKAMETYLSNGGKVLAYGPFAGQDGTYTISNRVPLGEELFITTRDGVGIQHPAWVTTELPATTAEEKWTQLAPGLFYNPHRITQNLDSEKLLTLCRQFARPLPLSVTRAEGYLVSVSESDNHINVQLLSEDYDVDIDHHLDSIRFHRSRVNYITKVEPAGVDTTIQITTDKLPKVYTPFVKGDAKITAANGVCTVVLPDKCSYAILSFEK